MLDWFQYLLMAIGVYAILHVSLSYLAHGGRATRIKKELIDTGKFQRVEVKHMAYHEYFCAGILNSGQAWHPDDNDMDLREDGYMVDTSNRIVTFAVRDPA